MRVMVFSAHPDDAEFAMGGTLVKLSKHDLVLAVMTDGSAGTYGNAEIRKKEQENSAKYLGAKLEWVGMKDCSLEMNKECVYEVAKLIRKHKPDVIFVPHWDQQGDILEGGAHPEHRIIGQLVKDATRYARFNIDLGVEKHKCKHLFYYMVPRHRQAKFVIPIDDVIDEFHELVNMHESQTQLRDGKLVKMLMRRRIYHAMGQPDVQYVEHFDCDKPILFDNKEIKQLLQF